MNTTANIAALAFGVAVLAVAIWFGKMLDTDREIVIRHVIDLTPIVKSK